MFVFLFNLNYVLKKEDVLQITSFVIVAGKLLSHVSLSGYWISTVHNLEQHPLCSQMI